MRPRLAIWSALNWPNRISIARLVLVAPYLVLLINRGDWPWAREAAGVLFPLLAVSDCIDGMLARKLDEQTRLGAILDPLADKVLVLVSVVVLAMPALAVPGVRLPNWVVVAVVGKDLWIVIGFLVVYLATDRFLVGASGLGKAATVAQAVMITVTLWAPELNALGLRAGTWASRATGWAVAAICVVAVVAYTRRGLAFVLAEQKPLEGPGEFGDDKVAGDEGDAPRKA